MTLSNGFQNFKAMKTILIEDRFDFNTEQTLISESGRHKEIISLHENEFEQIPTIYAIPEI